MRVITEESLSFVEIKVADDGIGMNSEDVKRVFTPFSRSNSQQSQAMNLMGNGMGLSICKQICEQLGGYIEVKSVPYVGSSFIFRVKVFMVSNSSNFSSRRKKKKKVSSNKSELLEVPEEQID